MAESRLVAQDGLRVDTQCPSWVEWLTVVVALRRLPKAGDAAYGIVSWRRVVEQVGDESKALCAR